MAELLVYKKSGYKCGNQHDCHQYQANDCIKLFFCISFVIFAHFLHLIHKICYTLLYQTGKESLMFPFLTIFIVFCIVLAYYIKKSDSTQQKVLDDFWEKERQANAVRKKDISELNYITIPLDKLPEQLHTSTEEKFLALAEKPMLNLTGISNTDLKLAYGTANLEILSEYDTNFADMVALLPAYAEELQNAGFPQTARQLLEFAIECNADSRKIYKMLAASYDESSEPDKILWLRKQSEQLPSLTRQAVQKDLNTYIQS